MSSKSDNMGEASHILFHLKFRDTRVGGCLFGFEDSNYSPDSGIPAAFSIIL